MLIDKGVTAGEVITLKLTSGEEIVAKLVEDGAGYYKLKNPQVLAMIHNPENKNVFFSSWLEHGVEFIEDVLAELKAELSAELIPRSMRLRSSSLPEDHLLHQVVKNLGLETFGSPTLSDQALIPYPSAKIGPGDSARSHTADEYIFTQEVKDSITTYISILENYASLHLQTKHPQ